VPNFIMQALRGEPLTIYGDGSQTRSFGYITDLVRGLHLLVMSALNEPVNIGNPQELTVQEMAELILRITGSKSELVYRALPEDDPKVRQPDIALARRALGWEPEVDVREALRLTVEWFRRSL
jgi:dTDP-glucose 4,6-dehydratase